MNFKKLGLAFAAASVFAFVACGDDSSTSATAPAGDEDKTVLSSDSNAGGDDAPASSSSVEDSTNESTDPAKEGSEGKTEEPSNDEPSNDEPSNDEPSNEEPNTEPPVDNPPDVGPGQIPFDTAGFNFDTTGFADMMKCDEEGATQNMMGAAVLVCTDGQWVYDSTATAAANKCDEEGATKTETMDMGGAFSMEMTYVCTDGQWEMQMPDFGGMFGGDSTGGFPGGMNFGDSSFTMPGGGMGDWGDFGGGNFGGAGEIPAETPGLK